MDNYSSDLRFTNMYSETAYTRSDAGVSNAAISGNVKTALSLLELKAGDSFSGEVSSVNGEEVNLTLSNGEILQARIEGNILLRVGQMLSFQVQSNEQNKIVLKPVIQNHNILQDSVLRTASLPVNDKTRNLVETLMEKGLPVDKQSLTTMYRASLNFPEAKLETLSMLSKMQIPLTKDNVSQYESYKNFEYKLADSMEDVLNDVEQVYNNLPKEDKLIFAKQLLGIFEGNTNSVENKESLDVLAKDNVSEVIQTEDEAVSIENKNPQNENADNNILINNKEAATFEKNYKASQTVGPNEHFVNEGKELTLNAKVVSQMTSENENTLNPEKSTVGYSKDDVTFSQNAKEGITVEKEVIENNKQALTEGGSFETEKIISKEMDVNKADTQKVLKPLTKENINQILEDIFKDEIKAGPKLKARLREEIVKNWMLEPKDVAEKKEIQRLYQRVEKQSRELQNQLDKFNNNEMLETKSASNIQKNLQFMQELDHVFSYVQLPLKFSEGKAHGDLYVMTNKKNLARKDGTLTAFLHLDMDNLGNTDIKLTLLTEQNKLRMDFYLQEDVIKLVSDNLPMLNNKLQEKGYIVKTSVNPYNDDKAPLEKMEEMTGLKMTQMSYQSFDIKA